MVIEQIGKSINKSNTIITTGVGNHQMMAGQFIDFRKPKQYQDKLSATLNIQKEVLNKK